MAGLSVWPLHPGHTTDTYNTAPIYLHQNSINEKGHIRRLRERPVNHHCVHNKRAGHLRLLHFHTHLLRLMLLTEQFFFETHCISVSECVYHYLSS